MEEKLWYIHSFKQDLLYANRFIKLPLIISNKIKKCVRSHHTHRIMTNQVKQEE